MCSFGCCGNFFTLLEQLGCRLLLLSENYDVYGEEEVM